ncbi:hypothetical protein GCM10017687_78940 [Streptomyces echinatus]
MTEPLHEARPPGTGRSLPDTQQGMRRRNLARVMHARQRGGFAVPGGGRLTDRSDQGGRVDAGGRADPLGGCWRNWAPSGPAGWGGRGRRSR